MIFSRNYIKIPIAVFYFLLILNVNVIAVEIPSLGDLRPGKLITIDVTNNTSPLTGHGLLVFYKEYILTPYTLSTIDIINFNQEINSDFDYGIVQVHTCFYNLSISFDKSFKDDTQQFGMNLGLIVRADVSDNNSNNDDINNKNNHTVYIKNKIYFTNVSIAVAMIIYKHQQPIPGGCDSSIPPPNDQHIHPILNIQSNAETIIVDTPAASRFGQPGGRECDDPLYAKELQYTSYHLFMKRGDLSCEMYFTGISQMLTVDLVKKNALLGNQWPYSNSNKTRSSYITLPGTGIVFSTLVTELSDKSMVAYVPAYTISCSPPFWESKCDIFASLEFRSLTIILIVLGIIRAYGGSFLFVVGVIIDGFILGTFVSFYIFVYWCKDYQVVPGTEYWIVVGSGLVLSVLLTIIYIFFPPAQFISELATALNCGYLMYLFVNYLYDETDLTSGFWWCECLLVLIIFCMFCCFTPCWSWSGITLSVCFGTLLITGGIMFLMGTHSSYLLINPIRSAQLSEYRFVNTASDSSIENFILIIIGCIIFGTAIYFQWRIKRKRQLTISNVNLIGERTPLITRMTDGSDDVFESPQTNYRYFERLRRSQRRMALRARPPIHQFN